MEKILEKVIPGLLQLMNSVALGYLMKRDKERGPSSAERVSRRKVAERELQEASEEEVSAVADMLENKAVRDKVRSLFQADMEEEAANEERLLKKAEEILKARKASADAEAERIAGIIKAVLKKAEEGDKK